MRMNHGALGALLLSLQSAWAQADLSACEALQTPHAVVIEAASGAALPAQAHWLDAERLLWPSQTAQARYRLERPGQPAVPLLPDTEPWPEAVQQRSRHLAAGARLRLPADWGVAQRQALLRGDLHLVQDDAQGRETARTRLQTPGAIDALFAPAAALQDYGVQPGVPTRGRLWAPSARRVEVCLYPSPQAAASLRVPAEWQPDSGSWTWQQPRNLQGWLYTYLVEVWVPGSGWVRQRVTDPFSVSLNANSARSAILDLQAAALKPAGWDAWNRRPRMPKSLHELVIYELHVRDFSLQDPRVPPAQRGRYLAFTAPHSYGMQHLSRLARAGVTDLHLLPVFDLATVPEQGCQQPALPPAAPDSPAVQAAVQAVAAEDCFNWGYDPFHFNAPEGSFASNAMDPAVRVREFRAMVMALQRIGLRVGMDMVYNHTAASGQHAKSVLDRVVPGYYQRLDAQGLVERSTCCDNTATEHRMMGKLMSDSVLLWSRAYGLDSFRFDLMGHQPRDEMRALKARLRRELGREIHFIGEGWNFGEVANGARFVQASQLSLGGDGIGTFSDRGRDALRGGSFGSVAELMASRGWSQGLAEDPARRAEALRAADLLRLGLAGNLRSVEFQTTAGSRQRGEQIDFGGQPAGYALAPGEAVAYVENHDNHTLFDANVLKLPPGTTMAERIQRQTLASAVVLFSQGVAYVHAGQELLRSKSLDRNSYDSGDAFNRLDFTLQDNGFGVGLPPAPDNGKDWPALAPLLRDPALKPRPADIRAARDQFLDLLRIRASSSLFRLPSAAEVQKRLRFHAAGPDQDPALLVAELDGQDWPGAQFNGLLLVLNASTRPQRVAGVPGAWRLHPVQAVSSAGDPRVPQQVRHDATSLQVPALSAVVFVR